MDGMRKCHSGNSKQGRLSGRFVSVSAARTAASLCVPNRKPTTLFFFESERSSPMSWRLGERPCSAVYSRAGAFVVLQGEGSRLWLIRQGWEDPCEDHHRRMQRHADSNGPLSIVHSYCWRGFNVLDVPDFHHFRINYSLLLADRDNHINVIENLWSQVKRNMHRFNGVPKVQFGPRLK